MKPRAARAETITAVDASGGFYPIEKMRAHVDDVPHLAVSVFLFRGDELLLQQRATTKYHSGGQWANTCCSHPHWQESLQDCAERRLYEEVGLRRALAPCGRIDYRTPVGTLFENEHVHCFVGRASARSLESVRPDPHEVQALCWMPLDAVLDDIARAPEHYTPWLRIYLDRHLDLIRAACRAAARLSAT